MKSFEMVRQLQIGNVFIHLWDTPLAAPIFHHPLRSMRSHPHRQAEFDAVSALIPEHWSWDDIEKDSMGKPFVKNKSHCIGISHSNGYACFAWSQEHFGIDIQTPHQSIFKVRNKFCHDQELLFLKDKDSDLRYLTLWSAKEAIYKYFGHGIDFGQDLVAAPFEEKTSRLFIECKHPNQKHAHFIVDCHFDSQFILCIARTYAHENNE
ncbi:MAG: hypothetical protein RLY35_1401 [Bacteroidota bacterium]|jgi:phosphopantetheinyl transferase